MNKEEWINTQLETFPGCNKNVLQFIADFRSHKVYNVNDNDVDEVLVTVFETGYCYYFAHMLQTAFRRGVVCCTGNSHMVWLDGVNPQKDVAYDISGVSCGYEILIPEFALGLTIQSFKHVPGEDIYATPETVRYLTEKYRNCTNLMRGE